MRHKKAHRKLGRTTTHRLALLKNLSIALIREGKIETTTPKAKELRSYVEKLITRARKGDFNAHRAVFASLQDKEVTHKTGHRSGSQITLSAKVATSPSRKLACAAAMPRRWR